MPCRRKIKRTEQCKFCMQIASLKLNFYHQATESAGLHDITWKHKSPIEAKLLKLILLKLRQSGISSNKQKFKLIMHLWNISYLGNCVTFFK